MPVVLLVEIEKSILEFTWDLEDPEKGCKAGGFLGLKAFKITVTHGPER